MLMRHMNCSAGLSNIKWINTMLMCLNFIGLYQWLDGKTCHISIYKYFSFLPFFSFNFIGQSWSRIEWWQKQSFHSQSRGVYIESVVAPSWCWRLQFQCWALSHWSRLSPNLSCLGLFVLKVVVLLYGARCWNDGGWVVDWW